MAHINRLPSTPIRSSNKIKSAARYYHRALALCLLLSLALLIYSSCSLVRGRTSASEPDPPRAPHSQPIIWAVDDLTKIRAESACPEHPATTISLQAARNEYEPFQIVIAAGERPLKQLDIEPSALTGNGHTINAQQISVYKEAFINVKKPSNIEGKLGNWPDALIPKVDLYTNEKRNAFPFDLAAQSLQPIWLDLYVPRDAAPGQYSGHVRVLESGKELANIEVKLEVWDFELPATASLPTSFGFSGISADRGHYGQYTSDEDIFKLTELYDKAALMHRISLHGGSAIPPAAQLGGDGHVHIDWKNYDREVGPFLDGKVLPNGARFTTIDLRTPQNLASDYEKIDYWRQVCAHFREKGWFDRLFDYTWDEPSEADYNKILAKAALLKQADPQLAAMVTKELNPKLQSSISIWTVVINYIDDKPGSSKCPPRAAYDRELAAGHKLWWYQSCMSHGCNIVGEDYFTGWPAYIIDLPAIYSRIMPWAAWKYRIGGELYYNTVEAYDKQNEPNWNPWENLYYFGGNGDGTLFYPGRPDKIGGHSQIPIESIRLKLIREGLEDYEYLKLANQSVADQTVNSIVTKTYQWDHDAAHLIAARAQLAKAILAAKQQSVPVKRP